MRVAYSVCVVDHVSMAFCMNGHRLPACCVCVMSMSIVNLCIA